MEKNELIFVHFDKLCDFMVRELYECKAEPLAWAICLGHIHRIPQFQFRCDINLFLRVDIKGLDLDSEALTNAINSIGHLIIEPSPGLSGVSTEAKARLSEIGDTPPVLIVRQASPAQAVTKAPKTPKDKKDWHYANALFAGPEEAFYDFTEGNKVVKNARNTIKDFDSFCEWRADKKRPALKVNILEVRKEYERYLKPEIKLESMTPAAAAKEPQYRKVKLKDKGISL